MSPLTAKQLIGHGAAENRAVVLAQRVNALMESLTAVECWRRVTETVLEPEDVLDLHLFLHAAIFADWDASQGPAPAWVPSPRFIQQTNIAGLMRELGLESYAQLHRWSIEDRGRFWHTMCRRLEIRFDRPYERVMEWDNGADTPRWFVGGLLNITNSCFSAAEDAPAIVFRNEQGQDGCWTQGLLKALTSRVANGLAAIGLEPGDAVAIDMPMTAESVAIYLGIIMAGCVAVSIADSFAPEQIATRLRIARAKAIFTQGQVHRGGKQIPLYERVVAAEAPRAIVLPPEAGELRKSDLRWDHFLSDNGHFTAVSAEPGQHTNILFSSGTTGDPKAIPFTHTAPIKCAADAYLHQDVRPGDVVAWPTNLGWMMGPWLIYASLLNRATIGLFDGAPTGRVFGRFVQDAGVTMLGVVPSLVKTWRTTQCMRGLDWRGIRMFSSTGECSNARDMFFLMSLAGYRPVVEYCGGTEIGGGYITGTPVQPSVPATCSTPALGLDFVLLDEAGQPTDNGEVFLVGPSVGLSGELLNRDHHEVYYANTPPGPAARPLRRHGDQIEALPGGYYRVLGRTDDTMNLGGVKVGSAEIERALNHLEDIKETAAVAVAPAGGGPSQLVVFAVIDSPTAAEPETLRRRMQQAIKDELNPLFKIHDVRLVEALPKTASNKVMRRKLRAEYGRKEEEKRKKEKNETSC